MHKRSIFLSIFLFLSFCAAAQKNYEYEDSALLYGKDTESDTAEAGAASDITGDTSIYERDIVVSPDTIEKWKAKKEYAYAKNLEELLKAQHNKKQRTGTRSMQQQSPSWLNSEAVKIFLWSLAIIFTGYVLYQLFISKGAFARQGKNTQVQAGVPDTEEILHQNFELLIQQACRLGDYRTATRYLFLRTLKQLGDKQLIQFSIDKTNSRYVYELPAGKRNEFAALVRAYEYIWYGNINIGREIYTGIETTFSSFAKQI